jgi:hypothetical protein
VPGTPVSFSSDSKLIRVKLFGLKVAIGLLGPPAGVVATDGVEAGALRGVKVLTNVGLSMTEVTAAVRNLSKKKPGAVISKSYVILKFDKPAVLVPCMVY